MVQEQVTPQQVEDAMKRMGETSAAEIVTKLMNQRPSFRARVKRKIALIEEELKGEGGVRVRHVQIEKAHGPFVPVVKWLLARSDREKLAAVAADMLIDSDVESSIEDQGYYDGNIGNELRWDWEEDISNLSGLQDHEDEMVHVFLMGVDAAR